MAYANAFFVVFVCVVPKTINRNIILFITIFIIILINNKGIKNVIQKAAEKTVGKQRRIRGPGSIKFVNMHCNGENWLEKTGKMIHKMKKNIPDTK